MSLRLGSTASIEEMSQWWQAIGNTEFDLTNPKFESHSSRSRDERVVILEMQP